MKTRIFLIINTILLAISSMSCSKFLDVTPKSSISEDEIFTSEDGFQQALSGVYSKLASRDLFSDNLSMGFTSALAQNYTSTSTSAPFYNTSKYLYETSEVRSKTQAIWLSAYNAIASANNILKYTIQNRQVLSEQKYNLIRGEGLALRAYIHFELARLFADSYILGANNLGIPYKTQVGSESQKPTTVAEIINLALKDLQEAEELLSKSDPILSNTKDRQFKMNYYAVKALEARIYLYTGAKNEAFLAAKEVIDSGVFPFVIASAVRNTGATKDRLFKSELIFALRVNDLSFAKDNYFSFSGGTATRLTRSQANFNTLYEIASGNSTDLRYNNLIETDGGAPFPSKFWQTYSGTSLDSNRLDKMIPLIRLSEMYYILAESSSNLEQGLTYLNQVRTARTIPTLTPTNLTLDFLTNEITKEYQKEYFGEGQLFFYYKRCNMNQMQFLSTVFDTKLYKLPIPDSELESNPNY